MVDVEVGSGVKVMETLRWWYLVIPRTCGILVYSKNIGRKKCHLVILWEAYSDGTMHGLVTLIFKLVPNENIFSFDKSVEVLLRWLKPGLKGFGSP